MEVAQRIQSEENYITDESSMGTLRILKDGACQTMSAGEWLKKDKSTYLFT